MNETHKGINYDLAKAEADKVDEEIIAALQNGNSFRVEAGAGSGKTYSLNKAIEWLQTNKWAEYRRKKQTVVCITYLYLLQTEFCRCRSSPAYPQLYPNRKCCVWSRIRPFRPDP